MRTSPDSFFAKNEQLLHYSGICIFLRSGLTRLFSVRREPGRVARALKLKLGWAGGPPFDFEVGVPRP